MLQHADAIVLRKLDYGDTSLIASVLTDAHGKVSFMVRGALKPKSPFAGLFEPGNILSLVYYDKPSRDLQTLKEACYAEKLFSIRRSLESMALVSASTELVVQIVHDHEPNPAVYDTLKRFLLWLDTAEDVDAKAFAVLQIRLADALGIGIQWSRSSLPLGDTRLDAIRGMLCREEESEGGGTRLTQVQSAFMVQVLEGAGKSALRLSMAPSDLRALIHHLDQYLSYHVEGLRPRASDRVFEQLLI
jgi:DNA repair protein RecO (recombination protein O)